MSTFRKVLVLAALLGGVACTVKDTTAPPLGGPSELALRVALQIVPDSILQDGASQAVLSIDATNGDGRPARGLPLRVEVIVDSVVQDYGTLSAKSIVTGDDGRARVTYTAPPRSGSSFDDSRVVTLRVTPVGNDYTGDVSRTVTLLLVTPGVILPPNGAPTAAFTFSPEAPSVLQDIVFDASTTVDGPDGASCGASCRYAWDFGDGGTASGVFVSHRFQRLGLYMVKLTVTDAGGATATVTRAVNVGQGTAPTATFTYSPTAPAISQDIFFNASASVAATGRRIVAWDWDFGSGRTASGMTVTKRYDTAGTYIVTLTVTDDAGAQATTTQNVAVGASGTGPQAQLTVSPTSPTTATAVFLDARASSGPAAITHYRFTFGDGTPDQEGTLPTATHQYPAPGTYVVRLTVRDTANRTATTTVNVTVTP